LERKIANGAKYSLKDSEGNELTTEQVEYFKDSKAKDDKGNLLVMYHGTREDFTVFEFGKSANYRQATSEFSAHWFSDNLDNGKFYAGGEGIKINLGTGQMVSTYGKVLNVYLNVKNPIIVDMEDFDTIKTLVVPKEGRKYITPDYFDYQIRKHKDSLNKYAYSGEVQKALFNAIGHKVYEAKKTDNPYDGVIFKNYKDPKNGTVVAVFESSQIKSVDNLHPTESNDIRYQLKETTSIDPSEYKRVIKDNIALQKANELLKEQFKLTKEIKPRRVDLMQAVRGILKKYSSTYNTDVFSENMAALWNYIQTNDNVDPEEVTDATAAMARRILEKSSFLDDSRWKQYKGLRDKLRTTDIRITDDLRSDISDFNQFRKDNTGRIKLVKDKGITVDSLYQELNEQYPDMFPDDILNQVDRLLQMETVLDEIKPVRKNFDNMDLNEESVVLSHEIFDKYFDILRTAPTFADKKKKELDKLSMQYRQRIGEVKQEYKKRFEDRLAEVKAENAEKIKEITKQFNESMEAQRIADEIHYGADKAKLRADLVNKLNEKQKLYQQRIDDLRDEKNNRIIAQQTKYRNRIAEIKSDFKTDAETRKHRGNIEKNVKDLYKWIMNPKDNKHVPEFMRNTVVDFLASIDFAKLNSEGQLTKKSLKWRESMTRLKQEMKQIDETPNVNEETNALKDLYMDIDPEFLTRLEAFIDDTQVRNLSELDADQMAELDYLVKVLKKAVVSANVMLANDRYQYITDVGTATIHETKAMKEKKQRDGALHSVEKLLTMDQMDAFTFGDEIGSAGSSIIQSLRKGFDKLILNVKKSMDYMDDIKSKYKDVDIKKIRNEVHTFTVKGGEVKLTTSQTMELYLLAKREQSLGHLLGGGIKVENKTVKNGLKKQTLYSYKSSVMTESELSNILSTLTENQKNMADDMRKFYDEAARWGNEVTLKLYDDMKFTEPEYYPIKTDENTNKTVDMDPSRGLYALKNLGVTKKTVKGANNPIIIHDIFDTFSNHVSEMANYNAFVVPLSDAMKWFNFKTKEADADGNIKFDTVKQGIERVLGKDGKQYFVNLINDINGVHKASYSTEIFETLLRNVKIASVGMNPSVMLQQPASILRAGSMIDYSYILKAFTRKPSIQKAKDNCPIALWKSWGFYEINIGRSLQSLVTDEMTTADKIREAFVSSSTAFQR
jgi:hypothetical protein